MPNLGRCDSALLDLLTRAELGLISAHLTSQLDRGLNYAIGRTPAVFPLKKKRSRTHVSESAASRERHVHQWFYFFLGVWPCHIGKCFVSRVRREDKHRTPTSSSVLV